MSDFSRTEQMVQRFVDQELSAEERIQFVVALGRDGALRQRAIDLERLVLGAATLPRPAVPDGFARRVLERSIRQSNRDRRRIWHRALDALWAPRAFQWNVAGAAAVACLVLLVAGSLVPALRRPAMTPDAGRAAAPAPAEPREVLVRLVVVQPGARVVQAAGDFNGWNPSRTPLEQAPNGAWTVTLPLEPGRYEYQFVVDGERWIGDPFAAEHSDDGFGSHNAVLDVRPAGSPL